jgi:hypothetical protein
VTLRARWVTLGARWVTLRARWGQAGVVLVIVSDGTARASTEPPPPPPANGTREPPWKKSELGQLTALPHAKWCVRDWLDKFGRRLPEHPGCVLVHVPSEEFLLLALVAAVIEVRARGTHMWSYVISHKRRRREFF